MDLGYPTAVVREGSAEIEVPAVARRTGPGTRGPLPFYNPTMAINRDMTVALAAAVPAAGPHLDGLAATGVAGIRVALEASVAQVVLNDANPRSVELARRNAARNGVSARIEHRRLQALLAEERFGLVDVDPFGSPVPFVDAAVPSVRGGGCLAVTATDVGTLGGVHPPPALRRYDLRVARTGAVPEVAVRALLGVIVRAAARYDRGARPVCAFAAEHFVRAIVCLRAGASAADEALSHLGSLVPADPWGLVPPRPETPALGPLWLGPLGDADVLRAMEDHAPSARSGRLLTALRDELPLPPLYVRLDELARAASVPPPPLGRFLDELRSRGFLAVRTHFSPIGVKSDAPPEELIRAARDIPARLVGA